MPILLIVGGFFLLFSLYQIPEAAGQGVLKLPWMPYSLFVLYSVVILAAEGVARLQGNEGLASFGLGLHAGWWQNYLLGLGLGVFFGGVLEMVGIRWHVRTLREVKLSLSAVLGSVLWVVIGNFPAAAAEDLLTRGYPFRFISTAPLLVFLGVSTALYVGNHIIRLLTKPLTDWYHLPFTGIYLAYALFQTGSLWYVIGLHQSGNVLYYLMHRIAQVTNTTDTRKRIAFGIASEFVMSAVVLLLTPFAAQNR